eukprot:4629359-Amphidinium_carterae.1
MSYNVSTSTSLRRHGMVCTSEEEEEDMRKWWNIVTTAVNMYWEKHGQVCTLPFIFVYSIYHRCIRKARHMSYPLAHLHCVASFLRKRHSERSSDAKISCVCQ